MFKFLQIKKHWLLIIALFIALILRLWSLGVVPPSLTWDEAALGYNAYSILQTGKDEYGTFLPLNLKSFGDYKPAVYTYLAIPFVAIFGLNEVAVRIPSALAGVILVLAVYFLVDELFKKKTLSFLSSLMVAISPLSLQFSRGAFESNIALTFNVLALLLFLKGLKNTRYFIWSAILFGMSLFTYQSARLFVPLLVVGLFIFHWKQLKFDRWLISSSVIGLIFTIVMIYSTFALGQSNRLAVMNFFAYTRSIEYINQISNEDNLNINSINFQLLHGEWFAYVRGLSERYLVYFSPRTLFIDGAIDLRHKVPDFGIVFYTSALFIPLGLIFLLRAGANSRLILLWLILAPIPAVLSRDLINMLRALNIVLPLTILEAAGIYYIFDKVKQVNKRLILPVIVVLVGLIAGNFFIYLDRYYIHLSKEYSQDWLYGYRQTVDDIMSKENLSVYNKVVFTDTYGQPYIYYLFYSKYPPQDFQKQAVLDQPDIDVGTVRKIDNIEFRHVFWPEDRQLKNSLFVGTIEELPDRDITPFTEYKIIKEVKFLDGQPAFRIVNTKEV